MNATGARRGSITVTTPESSHAPSAEDSGVIIACTLSSVAMVCLAAAMLYFRVAVLRREKALDELERLKRQQQQQQGNSCRGGDGRSRSISSSISSSYRHLSRTSSSRPPSLSKSWPAGFKFGSLRRQFSQPPRSPCSELGLGSLNVIPNGFGMPVLGRSSPVEPRTTITPDQSSPGVRETTKSERASSLPDAKLKPPPLGVSRRASWSFENPVFDQWVPPLSSPEPDDEDEENDDTSQDGVFDASSRHFFAVDSQLAGDGVALVAVESVEDTAWREPRKSLRFQFAGGYGGSPTSVTQNDHQLLPPMPTLHEREDNGSSGGTPEKLTAKNSTTPSCPTSTRDSPQDHITLNYSRRRSESIC